MEPSVWDRIQEIYYSALPIVPSERGEFVARACGLDPILVQEVSSLLEADATSGDFLESPIFGRGLRIITSNNSTNSEDLSPAAALELIGSTIDGRYLVEKKLSHGGMGTVYLARDLRLHNRPVVIKVLLQASLQDPYVVRKFKQEVEALARIDHPGVVSVLGAGELADGKPYIGMQFVNGVTLRSQIPSEGMNFDRAASILKQVGAALDNVHEKGIFHRDLKPENIMLQTLKGGAELVKIVDFGIAKVKDSVVAPSTVNEAPVGTVLYMSPEQLRGEKVRAASDIYSMAIIAYEMVTGRRPFNPTSGPQLLEMHRTGVRVRPIDLRPNLSTEAQAIILRALSFDPKDRYQSASEFGDEVARALSDDPASATPAVPNVNERSSARSIDVAGINVLPSTRQASWDPSTTPETQSSAPPSNSATDHAGRAKLFSPWVIVAAVSLILVVAGAIWVGIYMFRGNRQSAQLVSKPERSFSYWLTVRKMRDGRVYQEPFLSSGQEIFETGYKFRLNVYSSDPGYLYVFNEGPPEADGANLTLVYPTPSRKDAFVSAQPVQTNWNTFTGQAGTEDLWIVWSASPVVELESAKAEAFNDPKGALTSTDSIRTVKEFLKSHSEPKPESTKDAAAQRTNVRGAGDVLVTLAQLEHR